jgi:Flp pilus assembly protein TadB
MLGQWWAQVSYRPWWRQLLPVPSAIALLVVWLVVWPPRHVWIPIVLVGVVIAGYVALAVLSWRRDRRPERQQRLERQRRAERQRPPGREPRRERRPGPE